MIMHKKESIKPIYNDEMSDTIDGVERIIVFDYKGPETIHEVMRSITDYPLDDDTVWSHYKDNNTILLYRTNFYCPHQHDCCGCLCGHDFRIGIHHDLLIVTERTQVNV